MLPDPGARGAWIGLWDPGGAQDTASTEAPPCWGSWRFPDATGSSIRGAVGADVKGPDSREGASPWRVALPSHSSVVSGLVRGRKIG